MKILVFDTETTGLNPQWNVILQLSYQIVDSDTWSSIKTVNHYFSWPEDKSRVSQDAIKVNGLTEEVLSGKQLSNRKAAFEEFVADKDSCDLLVAHNLEFDKKFIIASCREEGVKYASSGWSQSYDTMKRTTNFCQIPKVYGGGYKWPKLIELAMCLGIDYSHISLHDSSGDVELTKLCFKQLVAIGQYRFQQDTGMTMSLHVESADDLQFVVRDKDGKPLSEETLNLMFKKKDINTARQELLKLWSEENEEERNDLIRIYHKSPKLKTEEDFKKEMESIIPRKYVRKGFGEQAPTMDEIQKELNQEAKQEVSSWMFWTLGKKRREYVESRMGKLFQQRMDAYNQRLSQFDESENKAEKEYNSQSQKKCEERKRLLATLIEGSNTEVIEKELLRVPDVISLSFPCHVEACLDGTAININISLPQPKDMPHLEGVRLASGNYKIKEISDKNKKNDYAECIWGIALYVAAYYFNVSPKINVVKVLGHVKTGESTDISLYNISFDRTTYSSLNLGEMSIDEALSQFHVTKKLAKEALKKLFVAKEIS